MRNLPYPPFLTKFFSLSRFGCLVFVLALAACSKTADAPLASSSVESSIPFDYEYAPDKPGEIQSVSFNGQTFTYRVVDGLVVIGGDMILGPVEEIEEIEAKIKEAQSILSTQSFGDTDFLGNYKSNLGLMAKCTTRLIPV